MKIWAAPLIVAVTLTAWSGVSRAQTAAAPERDGLTDLDAMTFSCPKAALNAASREAARAPSQGTYQFAYFRIINDSHHASYEIHFKSNYQGEPDLRYCVAVYCQQGWDPRTKVSVTLMKNAPQRTGVAGHGASCTPQTPLNRKMTR